MKTQRFFFFFYIKQITNNDIPESLLNTAQKTINYFEYILSKTGSSITHYQLK